MTNPSPLSLREAAQRLLDKLDQRRAEGIYPGVGDESGALRAALSQEADSTAPAPDLDRIPLKCAKRAAGVALQVREREALQSWPQLRDYNRALVALKAILAEPHGCVFCDSGKLRNPAKPHEPDCGFELARAALAGDQAEKDQA